MLNKYVFLLYVLNEFYAFKTSNVSSFY